MVGRFLLMLALAILVGYFRIKLGDHTYNQVVLAILISIMVTGV